MTSALRQGLDLLNQQNTTRPDIDPEKNVVGGVDIGQVTKGGRAAYLGMGANLRQFAGGVGEALGADQFAQQQYEAAEQNLREAGARGPRIGSFEQLQNEGFTLRNTGDYLAGMIGQVGVSALPAIGAGALASTPLGALAAGAAAYTPVETGDVIGRMRERSGGAAITGSDLLQATGTGALSSVAQTVPGAIVGGKIAGKAIGNVVGGAPNRMTMGQAVTRNLWEAPAEGASEALGTAIKQVGSGQGIDTAELKEAAIGGAVGGTMLSGVGAGADYVRGNMAAATDSVKGGIDKAKGLFGKPAGPDGPGEGPGGAPAGFLERGWDAVRDTASGAFQGLSESDLGKTLKERAENTKTRINDILADTDVPADIKAKAQEWGRNVGDKTTQAYVAAADKIRQFNTKRKEDGLRKAANDEFRSVADKIINSDFLGDTQRMASASAEQASEMLRQSGEKAADFTRRMGEDLLNRAGVSDETRQRVSEAMQNVGDKASQAFIASKWKAADLKDATLAKARKLGEKVEALLKKRKNRDVDVDAREVNPEGTKRLKSEDYSGIKAVIAGALRPHLSRKSEAFADDPEAADLLADSVRQYLEATVDTDGKYGFDEADKSLLRMQMVELLGPDTTSEMLADVVNAVGTGANRAETDRMFYELNELDLIARSTNDLVSTMEKSLNNGVQADRAQLTELAGAMLSWARGETTKGMTAQQAEFQNRQIEREMQKYFGSRSKAVMRQLEKTAAPKSDLAMPTDPDDQLSMYDMGIREDDGAPDTSYFGSGKDKRTLFTDPQVDRAKNPGYEPKAEAHIKRLKAENPDANVRFVSITERPEILDLIPAEKRALTVQRQRLEQEMPGAEMAQQRDEALQRYREDRVARLKEEGKGMLAVERAPGNKLTREQIDGMRLDTDRYANSPSRLEVVGGDGNKSVFDAMRMTREGMKRINRERTWTIEDDPEVSPARAMMRAFLDSYNSVATELGVPQAPKKDGADKRKFLERFNDVVVGKLGGETVTFGQLAAMDKRSDADKASDEAGAKRDSLARQIEAVSRQLADAVKTGDGPEIRGLTKELSGLTRQLDKLEAGKNKELSRDGRADREIDPLDGTGKQNADPTNDDIVTAAASLGEGGVRARTNMDGSTKGMVSNSMPNAKPLIAMAERIRDAGGIAEKIADRIAVLARNLTLMSEADQRRLLAMSGARKPSEVGELVNELARKYKDQIMPPKVTPPTDRKTDADPEGTPDPKAVAAKKAAFLEKAASGDKALIEELKTSEDTKGLQRAMDALLEADAAPEVQAVIRDRLAELMQQPGAAYASQTRKYSRERVDPNTVSQMSKEERQAILDYLFKVMGDRVQVEFANIFHSGDFTRTEEADIIRVSVHALNPLSTAYHESLHAFFQLLKDKGLPEVSNAVLKAVNSPHVMKQLRERLRHSPEALAQLKDPEERAAYAFQFYMSDPTFKLQPEPRNVFERIAEKLRNLLGVWSNAERAEKIMDYFAAGDFRAALDKGNPHQVYKDLIEAGRNKALVKAQAMSQPLIRLSDALVGAGSARLRDSGIPALRQLADLVKQDVGSTGASGGYVPASRLARTNFLNKLVGKLDGYTEEQFEDALEALQAQTPAQTPEGRLIVREIKSFLRDMRENYLTKAGVEIGDLGPDYFPRVWDAHYISLHQDEFRAMLKQYGVGEGVMHKIVAMDGAEMTIEVNRPGNQFAKERKLVDIPAEAAAPFLKKDFWGTMDSYITQATRRAEWARRFNDDNSGYDALIKQAVREGATPLQVKLAEDFVKGVNGTLGDNLDPSARRLMGNMIVYQNIRLLPAAIFSSIVDPMGVLVRGGTIGDAWQTLKRGLKELPKSWQKNPEFDAETELAETLGVIEHATLSHFMSQQYTQGMVEGTAKKINDAFFKYNFMEGFGRSMRVGASQAALRFIQRHMTTPTEHSARYLTELGLTPGDIVIRDGKLLVTQADGLTAKQAHAMRVAVNKWVDGAILRPDAADKPIWMNDPHWALISHLKSFVFAFHHTIIKRVQHEIENGNYKPAMALAAYVPVMLAADMAKDMVTAGFDEPEWKRNWTASDHLAYAVERSGILGVGQFALDGLTGGVGQLTGPTIDQLADAVEVVGGYREFSNFALRSMPANGLYREYLNNEAE